jgi:hypothetical protein
VIFALGFLHVISCIFLHINSFSLQFNFVHCPIYNFQSFIQNASTHAPPGSQTVINSKKPTLAHIFLFLISLHTHIMHQAGHARSGGGCRMKIRAKKQSAALNSAA